jgi:hypothetical protein
VNCLVYCRIDEKNGSPFHVIESTTLKKMCWFLILACFSGPRADLRTFKFLIHSLLELLRDWISKILRLSAAAVYTKAQWSLRWTFMSWNLSTKRAIFVLASPSHKYELSRHGIVSRCFSCFCDNIRHINYGSLEFSSGGIGSKFDKSSLGDVQSRDHCFLWQVAWKSF